MTKKSRIARNCLLVIGLVFSSTWATSSSDVTAGYESVVLRTSPADSSPLQNLRYECNNIDMRGNVSKGGLPELDGEKLAAHWRELAKKTRLLFAFRDSLFSQQDHPYLNHPYSLILPPNWITSAAAAKVLTPVKSFEISDENSWIQIASPEELFGSFPVSPSLFKWATTPTKTKNPAETSKINNARSTLQWLSAYSKKLIEAENSGSRDQMIKLGADLISQSDIRYFTPEIRTSHVMIVFVENPTEHELKEGKSLFLDGKKIDESLMDQIRNIVFRRRLEDGDIGIERYDLSNETEVKRAIHVLEGLIPKGDTPPGTGNVWMWVSGRLKPQPAHSDRDVYVGEDATPYIEKFRALVSNARIDPSRLRLLSKPSVRISKAEGGKQMLKNEIDRHNLLGLPLSTYLTTSEFLSVIGGAN